MMPVLFQRFLDENNDEANMDDDSSSTTSQVSEIAVAVGVFLIMIGVGASCKMKLFKRMFRSPKALKAAFVGVACQFVIMPVAAFAMSKIFKIEGYTALGMILAGSMPGGSASNVYTMWSQGVLELSVFMTVFSTILAFALTPFWLYVFSNAIDGISSTALAFDEMAISFGLLVIPLSIGVATNCFECSKRINIERPVSAVAVVVFAAVIILLAVDNPETLQQYTSWQVIVAAALYFPIGAGLSYVITGLLKFKPSVRRTIMMEVAFQNLALGFAIGQASVTDRDLQNRSLPFPLIYSMFMFSLGGLLVPILRRQKRLNDEKGIEDLDPDFFIAGEDEDDDKGDGGKMENGDNHNDANNDVEKPAEESATSNMAPLSDTV